MAAAPHDFSSFLRRNIFAAISISLSIVMGGAGAFLWNRTSNLEGEIRVLDDSRNQMLEMIANGPRLRQSFDQATAALKQVQSNLLVEDNLADNYWHFYKKEEQTGARLSELRQLSAPPVAQEANFKKVPFSFRLVGTFEEVSDFVRRVETGDQLARVSSFTLQRREPGGTAVDLTVTVDMLGRP